MKNEYLQPYTSFFERSEDEYIFMENLYNVQRDVNIIYNRFYKKLVDDVKNDRGIDIESYRDSSFNHLLHQYPLQSSSDILFGGLHSSDLVSPDCKKASKIKPVTIYVGVSSSSNFYDFGDNFINISPNSYIFNLIVSLGTKVAFERIPLKAVKRAKNEITEFRIKASIAHELSHWIDNSLHSVMDNIAGNPIKYSGKDLSNKLLLRKHNVNATYYELQAQIHGIAQIKKVYRAQWDKFTLYDLFNAYTALHEVARSLASDPEELNQWLKDLVKRMSREGILGKNMKLPVNVNKLLYEKITRI